MLFRKAQGTDALKSFKSSILSKALIELYKLFYKSSKFCVKEIMKTAK